MIGEGGRGWERVGEDGNDDVCALREAGLIGGMARR